MKHLHAFLGTLKEAFISWREDHAQRLGAALAYYAAFSVAPLILIMISITTFAFEAQQAQEELLYQSEQLGGAPARSLVQTVLENTPETNHGGTIAAVIGVVVLLLGAAGIFGQLKDALNTIWHVPKHPNKKRFLAFLSKKLLALVIVIAGGVALIISISFTALVTNAQTGAGEILPISPAMWEVIHGSLLLFGTTLIFALLYRFAPDVDHSFKQVLPGAFIGALLFTAGKFGLAVYIGYGSLGSSYGAAGSLIVFLFWLYYSAQIFLYGAEVAKVMGRH